MFVGRGTELDALDEVYRVAVAEGAAVAVVEGDAGIGKSRLVGEFTGRVDARVVGGDCLELGADSLPFAPFMAVVRRLRRDLGVEGIRAVLPAEELSLARWLPELGPAVADHDPFQGRSRLFDEVLTLLEGVAAQRPLVVVLEDLHWADPGSRELLAYLVRNLEPPGLLLLGTYRSSDVGEAHPLRPVIVDIARRPRGRRIELTALSRADVGRQLAGLLGREPDRALVTRVHERSDGNPLFVEALAADPTDGATPAPLRDWLAAAMAELPATCRSVLRAAAIVGREAGHELLAAVCGRPDEELEPALRQLIDRRLLVVRYDGYAFRQALFRDAVYGDLLPGERRRLHARCAEAVMNDPTLVPDGRATTEQAMHWNAAGDHEQALNAAWQAAADARRTYAYEQQLRMLERVLTLWDNVPEVRLDVGRAVVLHHAAEACVHTGAFERGIALATRALDELDPTTDPAQYARVLATRGLLNRRAGHDGDADLTAALHVMPADAPPELRGQTLAMLAVTAGRRAAGQARQYADEALHLGREHGLPAVQATALIASARIAGLTDDTAHALTTFREAGRIAEAASDHYNALTAMLGEAYTLMGSGDYGAAAVVAAKARSTAYRVGQARSRGADLAGVLAKALWFVGRWEQAREVIADALADEPPTMTAGVLLNQLGEISLAQGNLAAAAEAAAKSTSSLTDSTDSTDSAGSTDSTDRKLPVFAAAFRCRLAIAQGDLDTADQFLADALADPALLGPLGDPWTILRAGTQLRRALLSTASRDERRRQLADLRTEQLRDLAKKAPADRPVQAAHQSTFYAEIENPDPQLWHAAVAAWRDQSQPYELAQALFGTAESTLLTGNRAAAEPPLREAASLATSLDAKPLHHEIELLATRGRIDLTTTEPTTPPPADPFGLTTRELAVLRLLTAGLTNSQIATTLFISPSTAGVHVSRILTKLAATRRTEAATIAHRAGLFSHGPQPAR